MSRKKKSDTKNAARWGAGVGAAIALALWSLPWQTFYVEFGLTR